MIQTYLQAFALLMNLLLGGHRLRLPVKKPFHPRHLPLALPALHGGVMLLPQHFEEKDFHLHVPLSCLELSLADYPPYCLCSNGFSQTNRTNFFQGRFVHSSLAFLLCLTMLILQKVCSLNLDPITGHPTQSAGFRFSSSLRRLRSPRPNRLFLFVPQG